MDLFGDIKMKLCLAQVNMTVGNLQGNYNKITEYINKAKKEKCDIIVFPELTLSGYPCEDLLLKEKFISDQLEYVNKLKKETKDIVVVLGYIQPNSGYKPYNTCIVFYNGGELARIINSIYQIILFLMNKDILIPVIILLRVFLHIKIN